MSRIPRSSVSASARMRASGKESRGKYTVAHLGRTRASVEETGTFTPSGPRIAAVITYAAANGDRLVTSFSGTGTFPDQSGIVTVTGSETVTGGTGRFTGATGAMTRTVSVSVIRLSGEYETRGTLSY